MNWLDLLTGGLAGKVIDRVGDMLPNRAQEKAQEHERAMGQQATNTAEAASQQGGLVGALKAWRGFVGWCCGVALVWHVAARPLLMAAFPGVNWPGYSADDIALIGRILLGMLGLGV